ncbi:unnamed protein product [Ascophyllum nodosum]
MAHGRRSRSRSRSRSHDRRANTNGGGSSSKFSGRDDGGGRSGLDRRSSREEKGGRSKTDRSTGNSGITLASSRSRSRDRRDRDKGRDRNFYSSRREDVRDRDRDRYHRDHRDRKTRRDERDRERDRDRKRSRGKGEDGDVGDDDKLRKREEDELKKLKEIDVDALMVDEEEEERRLEEQRRKRKEKLEALQRRKDEEAAAATAAAATTGHHGGEKSSLSPPENRTSSSPRKAQEANGAIINTNSSAAAQRNGGSDDSEDDGAPIEIVKGGRGGGEAEKVAEEELHEQPQGKEDRPVFDMFSAAALSGAGALPGGKLAGKGRGQGVSYLGDDGGGDQGNWTDVEGYYRTRVGEMIGGRYTVLGSVGQGVFSTVLKCLDTRAGPAAVGGASEVALKMIRNNDIMKKAAQKEVALLKELAEHDPANRKHCIRLLSSLEHKQHVVMVFEAMQMNLRETLNKFGRKTGINVHAVHKYGKQLMAALKHMASRNLVHADIKPDNILVDQGFGSLKLADFGSAFRESDPDNDPTPYLVSRYYRAPEIVLGLEYDKAIDLWSVAVTLFELYKGSVVLPGVNNNQMLKRMMDLKGPVPTRMIKNHLRAFETMGGIRPHFTEGGQFMQQEPDPVTGKCRQTTVRLVTVTAPSRPIKTEIMRSKGAQDKKDTVANLADFLEKCMSLDPRQRMSLEQCSAHSFLRR